MARQQHSKNIENKAGVALRRSGSGMAKRAWRLRGNNRAAARHRGATRAARHGMKIIDGVFFRLNVQMLRIFQAG